MLGREIEALSELKKQEKNSEYSYPYEYVPKCAAKGKSILIFLQFDSPYSYYRYVYLWQKRRKPKHKWKCGEYKS